MIHIITLSNPQFADLFVNYMTTKGVHIHTQVEDQQISLWLEDAQQSALVEQELKTFLLNPYHSRYQAASWQAGKAQNTRINYRSPFSIKKMVQQSGPLTVLVVILCVLIYIWQQFVGDYDALSYIGWPDNDASKLEIWRYITPAFAHGSILHIAFNLAMWWYLASQTEQQLGTGKLFVILLVSALFSNWAQALVSGPYFYGLSGVIFALIAYVGFTGLRSPHKGIGVPSGLIVISILWIIAGYSGLLEDALESGIANTAHLAGFIIGLLMALWDNRHQLIRKS